MVAMWECPGCQDRDMTGLLPHSLKLEVRDIRRLAILDFSYIQQTFYLAPNKKEGG